MPITKKFGSVSKTITEELKKHGYKEIKSLDNNFFQADNDKIFVQVHYNKVLWNDKYHLNHYRRMIHHKVKFFLVHIPRKENYLDFKNVENKFYEEVK